MPTSGSVPPAERRRVFASSSLFGWLGAAEIGDLAQAAHEQSLAKGATLFEQGDPGESLAIVVSGELDVWGGDPPRVVRRLGPGDVLGEIAVLLGETRTATVTVARSARLLTVPAADFNRLCAIHPKLMEQASRLLARRLATAHVRDDDRGACTVVAVRAEKGLRGASTIAAGLAASVSALTGRETIVLRVDRDAPAGSGGAEAVPLAQLGRMSAERLRSSVAWPRQAPRVGVLSVTTDDGEGPDRFIAGVDRVVARLGGDLVMLVVDAGGAAGLDEQALGRVADVIVPIVATPRAEQVSGNGGHSETRVVEVLNRANKGTVAMAVSSLAPTVLPFDPGLDGVGFDEQLRYPIDRPWEPGARVMRRLARRVLGSTVGVALGGGAAFGVAHVGVLQVLDRNDIPVDAIAGTSMGSIVGAGYAAGLPPDDMARIAVELGTSVRTILSVVDLHPLRPGLLSGDRLEAIFSPLVGDVTNFDQLIVPYRAVTTDIERGERVCIGEGPIMAAARASASIPLLVSPSRYEGRVLVDGAVVDPVPAGVVREMGADICLSVNVVPQPQLGISTSISRLVGRVAGLNPLTALRRGQPGPNLVDLLMNTIQALQFELGDFKAITADVRINPDLADFTWLEFWRAPELIERGVQAAEAALPAIREVYQQRLAASTRG